MKATTLSISISDICNKKCPYCVSEMTNSIPKNRVLFLRNLNKTLNFAKMSNITSVIITGKGEPLLESNLEMLEVVCKKFSDFPIEVQTNGKTIFQNPKEMLSRLHNFGVDTVAISVDSTSVVIQDYPELKKAKEEIGINIRFTINLHSSWDHLSFSVIKNSIISGGIADQFSFRRLTSPSFIREGSSDIAEWIKANKCSESYDKMIRDFLDEKKEKGYPVVRKLPYGATLYDVDGLGFTYFDFCIQEESGEDDIRSLIYQLDGHLYTSWESSPASRIF